MQRAFRSWIERRDGTIAVLNERWAGSFWSTRYAHFDEVRLPNSPLVAEDKLSPHALLDLSRFQADTTAQFLDNQASVFVLSLLGILVQDFGLFVLANGASLAGSIAVVMQGIVLAIGIGLVLLSRRGNARGWLV